jgi:gliding motility-associated lipoprotein GldH
MYPHFVKKILMIIAVVLIGVACNSDQIYKNTITFENYRWQRLAENKTEGNTIEFTDIDVKNIDDVYDIMITIRHSGIINVDKVRLQLEIVSPTGTRRISLHNIKLKDREGKKFVGDVLGDLYDLEEKIKSFMSFTEIGKYTIKVTNLSSVFEIVGIIDMTLRVVKSNLDYNI